MRRPIATEDKRLEYLHRLGVLDTGPEERLDRLVRLAADICGVRTCLISLVDENRQWFKAKVGLTASETPRDIAFCGHAMLSDGLFCVSDALQDERFRSNPLVTGAPNIRFYAGAPLIAEQMYRLGTICVIDDRPRELTAVQRKALAFFADEVTAILCERERDRIREEARLLVERHKLQIAATSKMSALGEMASGIAHEINNPLSGIVTRAGQLVEMAEEKNLQPDAILEIATVMEKLGMRISKSVRALRSFARDGDSDPFEEAELRSVVDDAVQLCRHRLEMAVDLTIDLPPESLFIECRPVPISQILVNLLANAHDAVLASPKPWVHVGFRIDDDFAHLEVSDSGPGVPPEIRAKIMEPFFSTKPVGQGTGLGLSISQRIAHDHGGSLTLAEDRAATTFVVSLPLRKRPRLTG